MRFILALLALVCGMAGEAHAQFSGCAQGLCNKATGFTPASVSGLTLAWNAQTGVHTTGANIDSVDGAWGTSVALASTGTNRPTLAAVGPYGQNLFQFTSSNVSLFTFATTTLTKFTAFFVVSPATCLGAESLIGKTAITTTFIQFQNGCLSTQWRATVGSGGTVTETYGKAAVKSLQIIALQFDGSTGGGTGTTYQNCVTTETAATSIGTSFTFDRLGVGINNANPFNGYMSAVLVYNRLLSLVDEQKAVCNFLLDSYRPATLYAAAAGDDTSTTPWLTATPLASPQALQLLIRCGQTGGLKGGDVFRTTARILPPGDGCTSSPAVLDGGVWGTNVRPQIRYSRSPTPTLTSGTTYNLGPWVPVNGGEPAPDAAGGMACIYRAPGGVVSFSGGYTGYSTTNVTRTCTRNAVTPTTPAVGEWGYDSGSGNLYINLGVALAAGDMEVPVSPDGFIVSALYVLSASHRRYHAFDVMFANSNCVTSKGSHDVRFDTVGAFFCASDGIDAVQLDPLVADGTDFTAVDTISAYNGSGPATGGEPGDGSSCHNNTACYYTRPISVNNDKSQLDNQSGTVTTIDGGWFEGPDALWHAANATYTCGTFVVTNTVLVLPATIDVLQDPVALKHSAYSNVSGVCGMTAEYLTIYNEGAAVGRTGVQFSSNGAAHGATLTLKNNVVQGFETGVALGVGVDATDVSEDYSLYFGNTADFSGLSAGAHDVFADPLFVSAPANFALLPGSPAIGAGIAVPGVTTDFLGASRADPPAIGAYQ